MTRRSRSDNSHAVAFKPQPRPVGVIIFSARNGTFGARDALMDDRGVRRAGDLYGFSERMRFRTFKLGVNFLLPWSVVAGS